MRPLVSVRPIPETRPPEVHDDYETLLRAERGDGYVQGALAMDFPVPGEDAGDFEVQQTSSSDLPEPTAWAEHVGQAIVEVLAGVRTAPQLVRWTTPEVYALIARRAGVAQRRRHALAGRPGATPARPPLVRRVLVCEPSDGVAEASLVVLDGPRVRALALRLVGHDGRWRVTALATG